MLQLFNKRAKHYTDIVVGLQYGDEGKGKIIQYYSKHYNYDVVARASGGENAGHTIYEEGQKIVFHLVPSGIINKHISHALIGSGCVVNPRTFLQEVEYLVKHIGLNFQKIKIANNAHVITDDHIAEDIRTDKIGSTKKGIMPCYRDKYARSGIRCESIKELKEFCVDQYEFLQDKTNILVEGAQGFYLCPDHGDYPYVTSSPPTSAYALHSLGLSHKDVCKVIGVAKCYETYSGYKDFQPSGEIFNQIADIGEEYGATTGRRRKINWLNLDNLKKSIQQNGIDVLIINKMDILRKVGRFSMIEKNKIIDLYEDQFCNKIISECKISSIIFSDSPHTLDYSGEKYAIF